MRGTAIVAQLNEDHVLYTGCTAFLRFLHNEIEKVSRSLKRKCPNVQTGCLTKSTSALKRWDE